MITFTQFICLVLSFCSLCEDMLIKEDLCYISGHRHIMAYARDQKACFRPELIRTFLGINEFTHTNAPSTNLNFCHRN